MNLNDLVIFFFIRPYQMAPIWPLQVGVELIFRAILGYVSLGEKFLDLMRSIQNKKFLKPKTIMYTLFFSLVVSFY